jgi:hypothetical protein
MYFRTFEGKITKNTTCTLLIAILILLTFIPDVALSKRGGGDENRDEFYGIVQARPQNGLQGEWVISERTFIADKRTEFDETEGFLSLGSCAKVHIRNGRIHEIDSEPIQDCQ